MGSESPRKKIAIAESVPASPDRILEDAFLTVVQQRILESFSDALSESGFTGDEESEFRSEISRLSLEDLGGVLSMPHELKQMRLPKLHERITSGMAIHDVVGLLVKESRERGFKIGYHMSNSDIQPRAAAKGKTESWTIDGREKDHRDNDLPMAYYSTSLSHLYGKKRARFLYIIRAETGTGTTHKPDNDGAWGRATKLDVVDKLDYEEVMTDARNRANGLLDEDK
jgi:hypothetical protein